MNYVIKFKYRTGHTGESWDDEGVLQEQDSYAPYKQDDIEVVKEALVRMQEHWKYCRSLETNWEPDLPRPTWLKNPTKFGDWQAFNTLGNHGEEIFLKSSEYLGYFEYLQKAWIESVGEDSTLSFST